MTVNFAHTTATGHTLAGNRHRNKALSRRQFLVRAAQVSALAWTGGAALAATTKATAGLSITEAFDREVEHFMAARKIPGGALAVMKDGRLVYARGYGWGDREKKEPARPDSLFRIASISKPFTAVAALKLVEAGRLDPDARAFDLLPLKPLAGGKRPDARLKLITIRHLLHHTGGWDRDKSGDPMFRPGAIAHAAALASPPNQETIIRYMLSQKLDFAPGSRYAYSNFGYCVLGRIIARVSGFPYDRFVQQSVLTPAGIRRMQQGSSLEAGRANGEVKYYTPDGAQGHSVFSTQPGEFPQPYGTFYLEAMDSHGGWLASAVDLVRFAAALDGSGRSRVLKPETCQILYEAPTPPVSRKRDGSLSDAYYACGWQVRPVGLQGKANYWHSGSLPGTSTLLVRRADGLAWAVVFNQRSQDSKLPDGAIDGALHRAADAVAEWPKEDLFGRYG
jgi:N-acyl-D-amino-acid deacylase